MTVAGCVGQPTRIGTAGTGKPAELHVDCGAILTLNDPTDIQMSEDAIVELGGGTITGAGAFELECGAIMRGCGRIDNPINLRGGSLGSAAGCLFLGGVIDGCCGFFVSGAGTIILENPGNIFIGNITISAGVLALGGTAIPAGNDLILSGGTFSTGLTVGFTETVTNLTLTDNSTLNFGTGVHQFNITALNLGGNTLTITGWGASAGISGTGGKLFAFPGAYSTADLANVNFFGFPSGGMQLASGEIVPFILFVPEPSTWLLGGGLTAIVACHFWRRQWRRKRIQGVVMKGDEIAQPPQTRFIS